MAHQPRPAINLQSARSTAPSSNAANGTQSAQNAVTVERYVTSVRFENNGIGERDLSVRMRIDSAAGAQQLRALSFEYDAASETMELAYLRVHKPNGAVVEQSAADSTNEPADASIAKNAPAYASLKQFRVALPSLAPGDMLEYEIVTHIVKPAAPGQFWFQHNFLSGTPARDERLEISLPASRAIIVRSPHFTYNKVVAGGRAIYVWKRANEPATNGSKPEEQAPPGAGHPPDVQLTSFANWAEVARWYASLVQHSGQPDSAIRAKTAELTRGAPDETAKIQALYDYVCKSVRHVDISFSQNGYQPRSAADIFSSGYADAKDEQVLLAAMLGAADIHAVAVLIPYTRKLDLDVPSPAQFQHVLTTVPVGERTIWMDSSVGFAPFGLLPAPLRGKSALLISGDGAGRIVTTPADPTFRSAQKVDVSGAVSSLGLLTGRVHYSLLGDTELALRLTFQNTPESQWDQLGQTLLAFDGIHGQVSSVKTVNLSDFEKPFQFDVNFTEAAFFDWSAKSTTTAMPLLAIGLPTPPQERGQPVDLGSPLTVDVKLQLQLPENFAARPPTGTSIARDFAEFHSSYRFAGHIFSAERSMSFKIHDIPAADLNDYLAFARAVTLDQNQPLAIEYTGAGKPVLPESVTPEQLVSAGEASLNAGDAKSALPLFQRALQIDPKLKGGWNDLGLAYMRLGDNSSAAAAFRKQLDADPADEHAGNYLGAALERARDFDGAMAAFHRQTEDHPLDPVAHAALGELLVGQHQYAAAIPELEKGEVLAPRNPEIQIALGGAYLNLDKIPEAANAFDHAARISPTPAVLDEIAGEFASRQIALDKARQYAEAAVAATEEDLRGIDLAHVTAEQIAETARLGSYWDTLGWVYFQQGDVKRAEPFVRAAWRLTFNGQAGDHLAQIYRKLGDKPRAIQMCALALSSPDALPDTRARLTLLLGGNATIDELVAKAKPEFDKLRTIPAGKFTGRADARAEFLVLLSPGERMPRVEGIRFLGGDESLRPLEERLRKVDYGDVFPAASRVELIRGGTLACSAKSGDCEFRLARSEVQSATN